MIDKKKYAKEYYIKNREKIKIKGKNYKAKNKERTRAASKIYYLKNKERISAATLKRYVKNKNKIKAKHAEWRATHKEEIKAYNKTDRILEKKRVASKKYYIENKEKMNTKSNKHYAENKEAIKSRGKAYRDKHKIERLARIRQRRKTDLKFRLNANISGLIRKSLRGNKAGYHWENLVGYTLRDLKRHLESLFEKDMNWNNRHEWHLDHKIPISVFNFTKPEHIDFKRCWALKNLQPMWIAENLKKHNKIKRPFQPSLLIGNS